MDGKNEKEIRIKAISKKDTASGPKIALLDGEGVWYSVFKTNVKDDTWDELSALKEGDRVDITWTASTSKRDGKTYFNLTGFSRVIQKDDEVRPPTSTQGDTGAVTPPVRTGPAQDMSPKQTAIKSATDVVVALCAAGVIVTDPIPEILSRAKLIHAEMIKAW